MKYYWSEIFKQIKNSKSNIPVFFLYFFISIIFVEIALGHNGIAFKYDWLIPNFDIRQFFDFVNAPSLNWLAITNKNGLLVMGLLGFLKIPSSIFVSLFLISFHSVAAFTFYLFIRKRIQANPLCFLLGFVYSFTPYVFIREIVGFMWSLVAYALVPLFLDLYLDKNLQTAKKYLGLGLIFTFLFSQIQSGLLVIMFLLVDLAFNAIIFRKNVIPKYKTFFITFATALLFNFYWIVMLFRNTKGSIGSISGGGVATLNFIASLPHSFRNFFMLSDHHITSSFFYPLAHDKLFIFGWLIVWFVAFCAIFNKKNRALAWTFIISCLLVLPFIKGPVGKFGNIYIWFYNHVPQIAVFRETYHFEFLYAISLCVLFAFGLDFIWQKIDSFKTKNYQLKTTNLLKIALKSLTAGSAIFIIAPYLTFNYAGYLKLQKIPTEYTELHDYFQENKNVCHKIYYPPGTGFIYFKGDKTPGASNSDVLASSLGVPYVTDGTSVLNLPSEEMFYRNELVSQFYEKGEDSGQFASLLKEGEIDCVVLRLDTESMYPTSSNLWQEKEPAIVKKWNNIYLKELVESKQGMKLEKQFGENIYVYKSGIRNPKSLPEVATSLQAGETNINFQNSKLDKTGKPASQQFVSTDNRQLPAPRSLGEVGTTYNLPLTDWANNFAYYKDGWSRGRYDFWRKLLFTQLRQDFIYTDKGDSTLTGKVEEKGDYEVWGRSLNGGTAGSWQLAVSSKTQPTADSQPLTIAKDAGEEKFVWKKLGDVKLDGKTDIEIKNINGENAIADIVLVPK